MSDAKPPRLPDGSSRPNGEPPEPRIRPSSPGLLVAAGLTGAAAGWVLFNRFYSDIPSLPLLPAVTLLVLAVVETIVAVTTRRRIERRPGTEPVNPLAVARYVLVAKASSSAGAIFTGVYAGVLIWLIPQRSTLSAASADVTPAAAGLAGAVLLLVAALWLEHSCRIPDQPDDEDTPPPIPH